MSNDGADAEINTLAGGAAIVELITGTLIAGLLLVFAYGFFMAAL